EAVVPQGLASLKHGVEDIALLDAEGRVGRGMVAGSSQKVGSATAHACRRSAVVVGPGRPSHGVAFSIGPKVHRHVTVWPLRLLGQPTIDEGAVDLLRERFPLG